MKPFANLLRITLIILNIFLSLSAVAGAIQLLEGTYAPPLEILRGSIFANFIIPALSLGLIVGGSAMLAAVLLARRNKFADLISIAAGIIIMIFEFVEVLAIGSDPGVMRTLQLLYFGTGALIVAATLLKMFLGTLADRQ